MMNNNFSIALLSYDLGFGLVYRLLFVLLIAAIFVNNVNNQLVNLELYHLT